MIVGGTLKLWNGGTLNINGGAVTANSLDVSVGTLDFNDGTLTVNSGTYTQASGPLTIDGNSPTAAPLLQLTNGATTSGITSLIVGNANSGSITINGGSTLTTDDAQIAANPGSTGSVTVTGAGSTWSDYTNLIVGNSGAGQLNILQGGKVIVTGPNVTMYIGNNAGSQGTVVVSDPGSGLNIANNINLLQGSLMIHNGGTVSDSTAHVGVSGGSSAVTIDGPGSSWTTSTLGIGVSGDATVTAQNGGQLTVTNGVGVSAGVVIVQSGATATSSFLSIGEAGGPSIGNVTVTGHGSTWTSSTVNNPNTGIYVGDSGVGVLNIQNGGQVTNGVYGSVYVGNNLGANGTITVSGTDPVGGPPSALNVVDSLFVGYYGAGTLNVLGGAAATSANGSIGDAPGSTGTVNVGGVGSSWVNSGTVAFSATGTLNINGGTVHVGGLDTHTASSAVINLNCGTLRTPAWTAGPTTNLSFNGGTLQAAASSSNFLGGVPAGGVVIYVAGAVIDTNGNGITITQNLANAAGSGVSAVTVATPDSTTVFASPPAVIFSSGGATGYTTLDDNGHISGIVVTNPGSYPAAPTASIAGRTDSRHQCECRRRAFEKRRWDLDARRGRIVHGIDARQRRHA